MTGYVGLTSIIDIRAGETILVSGAAGAVGSVVCQIAKIRGATVIGSAGGAEKCAFLREIGVDRLIDYKAEAELDRALATAAPEGIDAYFDNVGGTHLEAALANAKPFARFAMCGMISQSNATSGGGPANIGEVVRRRLRLEGFVVSDHWTKMPAFVEEMAGWIAAGEVKWRQTVDEGIEAAPKAFLKLFSGDNIGKMLVRLSL